VTDFLNLVPHHETGFKVIIVGSPVMRASRNNDLKTSLLS